MGSKRPQPTGLPQDLAEAKKRVEHWRRTREKAGPMPEDLWDVAVRLVRRHGTNPVARALNLDYYSLKRRCNTSGRVRGRTRPTRGSRSRSRAVPSPAFVEVDVTSPQITPECILELVGARGVRMTLRLRGPVDVVRLAEAFWRRRR